jgi:hypothetical protein
MLKLLSISILQSLGLSAVAIVESVIGIPFLFFIFATVFLLQYGMWLQALLVVIWSILAAAVFAVPIAVVAGLLVAGLMFVELGGSWFENRTTRVVLLAFGAAGVIVWLSGIVWSTAVIVYALLSVVLGAIGAYHSAVFQARRHGAFRWKTSLTEREQ